MKYKYSDSYDWKKIPLESKKYVYSVCMNGEIKRTAKDSITERNQKPYMKNGKLYISIANKERIVKHLVAEAFLPGYRKGCSVLHRDGNPTNCNIENLFILSKFELGKISGGNSRRMCVTVNGKEYYSIRDAAKSIHCSEQTLLNYTNGKVKNSVLDGYEIEKRKEREL